MRKAIIFSFFISLIILVLFLIFSASKYGQCMLAADRVADQRVQEYIESITRGCHTAQCASSMQSMIPTLREMYWKSLRKQCVVISTPVKKETNNKEFVEDMINAAYKYCDLKAKEATDSARIKDFCYQSFKLYK